MKYIKLVSVACACLTVVLFPATQASATIGYSVPSAIITQLDGYTVSCEMTADGTIISVLSSETVPGEKDVNYITKDEQNFRHLEYSGKDYLISVTPADENAFVQEYGQSNGIVRLANGSYILCSKSTEPIIANLSESSADFLHDNRCVSDWSYSDAKASYDQICALKSVDSAKILQGHIQYTYGEGAYSLQLFASAPVTEESFAFLTEGLSVEIDVDDNYPSVTLLKDGKPVDDYAQLYEFYCDILDNIPAVKAVYPCYWYLQFEGSSMVYEVIEEKNAETTTTTDFTTIVSYSESTTTTATTPTALPDTTEDTTTTSSEQGHDKLYQGYLVRHDYQPYYYVGDSFDYDRLQLCLFVLGEDGTLHDELMYCRFFASEEKYQNCYTVDTSAVDFSTPGDYEVTLRMNPGERALFHSKASTVKGSLPEGDYNVEMIDYSMTFTVSVMKRQDPDKLFFTPDYREYPLGGTYELLLRNAKDKDISCEIEDETIAVIRGYRESGKNIYYSVELLAEGETTLTAVSSDGQTASVKLLSLTQEEYDRRTHTTMISSNTTTTTTTATTADTADFSDTTEISQNSTDSSEVTTALSGETETSTTSADLPQTGNNSLRYLLIILSASGLIGFGMLAVVQSGVIRRRKDEQ